MGLVAVVSPGDLERQSRWRGPSGMRFQTGGVRASTASLCGRSAGAHIRARGRSSASEGEKTFLPVVVRDPMALMKVKRWRWGLARRCAVPSLAAQSSAHGETGDASLTDHVIGWKKSGGNMTSPQERHER